MRDENEFNKTITEGIKRLGTSYRAIKASDRFHIGMPDWFIFHDGRTAAVEAKFVKEEKQKGAVLSYKMTGAQYSFMQKMELAGVPGWLLLGVKDVRRMFLIPAVEVIDGQIYWEDFVHNPHWKGFYFHEVRDMVDWLFGGYNEHKGDENAFATARGDEYT